jgi:hypothetical protein
MVFEIEHIFFYTRVFNLLLGGNFETQVLAIF